MLDSSFPVVSSSCPCLFRIETKVHILTFWSLEHVFREACPTVNWFACCRFERYGGGVATVRTYGFEHSFLGRLNHLYWCRALLGNVKNGRKMMPSQRCWLNLESSSWWSSFRIAISTVNRSAWVRLEWNFTVFSTISTNCLMHFFLVQYYFNS